MPHSLHVQPSVVCRPMLAVFVPLYTSSVMHLFVANSNMPTVAVREAPPATPSRRNPTHPLPLACPSQRSMNPRTNICHALSGVMSAKRSTSDNDSKAASARGSASAQSVTGGVHASGRPASARAESTLQCASRAPVTVQSAMGGLRLRAVCVEERHWRLSANVGHMAIPPALLGCVCVYGVCICVYLCMWTRTPWVYVYVSVCVC